jgi:hypothetical protein
MQRQFEIEQFDDLTSYANKLTIMKEAGEFRGFVQRFWKKKKNETVWLPPGRWCQHHFSLGHFYVNLHFHNCAPYLLLFY